MNKLNFVPFFITFIVGFYGHSQNSELAPKNTISIICKIANIQTKFRSDVYPIPEAGETIYILPVQPSYKINGRLVYRAQVSDSRKLGLETPFYKMEVTDKPHMHYFSNGISSFKSILIEMDQKSGNYFSGWTEANLNMCEQMTYEVATQLLNQEIESKKSKPEKVE